MFAKFLFPLLLLSSFCLDASLNLPTNVRTKKSLLVTGCGRSGTGFTAEFLKLSGYDVGHEHMGKKGTVSWLTAARVDEAPWGPLWNDYEFRRVFHQVRNPIKVIQSVYNVPPRAGWDWIASILTQIKPEDSRLTMCVKYWIYWNRMVEIKADFTYRVEDMEELLPLFAKKLHWNFSLDTFRSVPKNTNTKGPPTKPITWAYLREHIDPELYLILEEQAIRYGYVPE
jgi:hypothetical protein